ncbi:hypothetical protein HDU97_000156 [Phlyctochytrium planicorne]|nr:hypothetical protein HDU97_000156 [Phlyctochytrium planicorne]
MGDESRAFNFLRSVLPGKPREEWRPRVVLTYAQSLDGVIGGRDTATGSNQPLAISCSESLILTHALRACSDGIMVGVGTVVADDPRLNVRLVSSSNAGDLVLETTPKDDGPRPIILDRTLRIPKTAKILARKPIIYCGHSASNSDIEALRQQGASVTKLEHEGTLPFDVILRSLKQDYNMKSLMVEGGSTVIKDFLNLPHLIDRVLITIAPIVVNGGVYAYDAKANFQAKLLQNPSYMQFGRDIIMAAQFKS